MKYLLALPVITVVSVALVARWVVRKEIEGLSNLRFDNGLLEDE